MLHAVIMAGGSGTRFWPQSRRSRPKQLLRLAGERTMIQATVDRVADLIPPRRLWIVTNREQAAATAEQLPDIPSDNLLAEPCGRNTAPCIGLAAIHLLSEDSDAVMLVMPADHVIRPDERFVQAVQAAVQIVQQHPERLVLFGVKPTYPSTGFGYIERGNILSDANGFPLFRVQSFREKPDRQTAEEYVTAGNFYWNCGIFVWRADRILQLLEEYEPDIAERLQRLQLRVRTPEWTSALESEFPQMKHISIDYAVLERAADVVVMEAPFEWDDVGSWEALPRLLGTDEAGNTIDATHAGLTTRECIIRSTEEGHLIATWGVDNLIIVHTDDATLVCRRGEESALRELVEELKRRGYDPYL